MHHIPEISVVENGETSNESPGHLKVQRLVATSASSNDVYPELFRWGGKHFTKICVLNTDMNIASINNHFSMNFVL